MTEGVDYAWARPDPVCLFRNGKRFVVRYVGPDTNSGKWLRASELAALRSAGLQVALVYQTTANFMLNGREEGVRAGQRAIAMADGLGIRGRPVYHALDTDPRTISAAGWTAIKAYLDGVASVMGRNRVGIYAAYLGIEAMVPTWAPWGWQTYAWSGGRVSGKAHLLQYRNGQNLCGGELDLCRSLKSDFGQWPIQSQPPEVDVLEADHDRIAATIRAETQRLGQYLALGQANQAFPPDVWGVGITNPKILAAVSQLGVDVDEAALAQALIPALTAALSPTQLADLLADALGPELGQHVVEALGAKLSAA